MTAGPAPIFSWCLDHAASIKSSGTWLLNIFPPSSGRIPFNEDPNPNTHSSGPSTPLKNQTYSFSPSKSYSRQSSSSDTDLSLTPKTGKAFPLTFSFFFFFQICFCSLLAFHPSLSSCFWPLMLKDNVTNDHFQLLQLKSENFVQFRSLSCSEIDILLV